MQQFFEGVDKGEFMRHWEMVYGVHEDHYREQDPEARLGVSWVKPYSFTEKEVDETTGEVTVKRIEKTTMRTAHIPMFDTDQLWSTTEDVVRRGQVAYIGYVPRKGSIVNAEQRGAKTRGGESQLLDIPEVIADFDTLDGSHKETNLPTGEQVLGWLAACPAGRPTFTVRSGGGYHAHWCLAEPLPLAEAKPLMDRLADWIETLSERHGVHAGDEKVTRNPAILFRMAGTVHGKPGPKRMRRVQIVDESGLRYTPDDFDRLPFRVRRVLADAAREERALARRAERAANPLTEEERQKTPWYLLDRAVPVSEVLERIFFMKHNGSTMTSPTEWRVDSGRYEGDRAHVTLYQDPDGVERFTANGQRTAANLGVPAGKGSYGTFSLVTAKFCKGDTKMAASVARRYLASGIEGIFAWLEERADGVMPPI